MNKQELIKMLNRTIEDYANKDGFGRGVRTGLSMATFAIKRLDEPEKVVLPEFVAEAFEKAKGDNWFASLLINAMYDSSDEVGYWLEVPSNEKLLLRYWLDGYEVEKVVIPQFVADYLDLAKSEVSLMRVLEIANRRDELPKWEKEYDWISANDEKFARAWLDGYEVEKEKLYYIKFSENQYAQRFDGTKIDSILINDKSIAGKFTKEEIEKMNSNFMALAVEVTE